MRITACCLHLLVLIVLACQSPSVLADSAAALENDVVQVQAFRGNKLLAQSAGVIVAKDTLVASAVRLQRATLIRVRHPGTGAEAEATVISENLPSGIALLQASGLPEPQLVFATGSLPESKLVRAPAFNPRAHGYRLVEGYISRVDTQPAESAAAEPVQTLQHNALISAAEYGTPLLNECSEIVGFNRPDPAYSKLQLRRSPDPDKVVFAVAAASVRAVLQAQNIAVKEAKAVCQSALASARERAQRNAEEASAAEAAAAKARSAASAAAAQARAAQAKAAELAERADATAAQKAEAEQQALAAQEAAEAAKDEAQEREAEALEQQQRAEQAQLQADAAEAENLVLRAQQHWLAIALAAAGALLLVVIAVAMVRGRRKRAQLAESESSAAQAQAALAQAIQPAAFSCLLEGADLEGRAVTLKVSAQELGVRKGVVIGRNPERAGVVLDHEKVSREHLRLLASGRELFIEDLESGNGTAVNGRALAPRQLVGLRDGDTLEVGETFTFTVHLG